MSANRPLVSVVIPAYDQAEFIEGCLDSVAAQRWEGPLEVIVVDDGSPDDVGDRARSHPLETTVIRQPNRGVAAARNRGIDQASGEWVAFLDADDRWTPDKLQFQLDALREFSRPALSFCRYRRLTADGRRASIAPEHPEPQLVATPRRLMWRNFVGTSTVLVHRRCLQRCGGFPETEQLAAGGQDYALWLRIAAYFPLVYVPRIGMEYTLHEDNRVGADAVSHHRGGLQALKDFVDWDPARFQSLSPAALAALAALRTGKFALDTLKFPRRFPTGSLTGALRETISALNER